MWDGLTGFDVFPLVEFLLVSLSLLLIASKSPSNRRLGNVRQNGGGGSTPSYKSTKADRVAIAPIIQLPSTNGRQPLRPHTATDRSPVIRQPSETKPLSNPAKTASVPKALQSLPPSQPFNEIHRAQTMRIALKPTTTNSAGFSHQTNGLNSAKQVGSVRKPSVPSSEPESPSVTVAQSIQRLQGHFSSGESAEGLRNRQQMVNGGVVEEKSRGNNLPQHQHVNNVVVKETSAATKSSSRGVTPPPQLPTAKVQPVRQAIADGTMTVGRNNGKNFTNRAGNRQPIFVDAPMIPDHLILEGLRKPTAKVAMSDDLSPRNFDFAAQRSWAETFSPAGSKGRPNGIPPVPPKSPKSPTSDYTRRPLPPVPQLQQENYPNFSPPTIPIGRTPVDNKSSPTTNLPPTAVISESLDKRFSFEPIASLPQADIFTRKPKRYEKGTKRNSTGAPRRAAPPPPRM